MRKARLLLLFLLLSAAAARAEDPAWKAVWRSEEAPARVSLSGRVRTKATLEGKPREATAEVYVSHGKLRLDYQAGARHWSLLDNGQNLIRLQPDQKRARVLRRPQLAFDRALAERNYVARRTRTDTVAGRPVDVIEIAPRGHGNPVWRLWVDRASSFVLKREQYNVDGRLTTATEYLAVDFSARPAAQLFETPADYTREPEQVRGERLGLEALVARAGFPVRRPRYLPPGYVFLSGSFRPEAREPRAEARARLRGSPSGPAATLRYTDGLRILSIVQRPAQLPRGNTARRGRAPENPLEVVDRGDEKVLRRRAGDRVIVVVGDLTQDELVRVANGVE